MGTAEGTQRGTERLHWSLEAGGLSHMLDLLPDVVRGSVAIEVDGRAIARMPKPTPQWPWRETVVTIDTETFVVGLTWQLPLMSTDVCTGGRSLLDGRSIEDVRGAAPRPLSDYEVWIGGLFRSIRVPPGSLVPRWMAIVGLVSIAALALVFRWQPPPRGLLAGLAVATPLLSLFLIWFRSWVGMMDRIHRYLLARPLLGDARRLAAFFGVVLGYPVVAIAAVALLALVSR